MYTVTARNVNHAFTDALMMMKIAGKKVSSRNGPVLKLPRPLMTEYTNPSECVLFNPVRDANPAFHLFEALWMFAGDNRVAVLTSFNKRMQEYSDDGKTLHGAYGYRWQNHYRYEQIQEVVRKLTKDKYTRRAVIAMWDAYLDLTTESKDIPCNTHVYFNYTPNEQLDMTVCCRSNDLIWGAYGSNVVHFSLLHQVVAQASGLTLGNMRQLSNDAHVYLGMPRYTEIMNIVPDPEADPYYRGKTAPWFPIVTPHTLEAFLMDCKNLMLLGPAAPMATEFMRHIACPMFHAYLDRREGRPYLHHVDKMYNCDWKLALIEWINRRNENAE